MVNGIGGCWRKGGILWHRVLCARYGEDGGRLQLGGGGGSVWWQQLNKVVKGVGLVDGWWLVSNIVRVVDLPLFFFGRIHG